MVESDFLSALVDDLDDVATWQVYADWLEERADPRGEYIRLHVELEEPDLDRSRRSELFERLKRLELEFGDVSGLEAARGTISAYRFGLAAGVRGAAGRILGIAGELKRHPLAHVHIQRFEHRGEELARWLQSTQIGDVTIQIDRYNREAGVLDAETDEFSRWLTVLSEAESLTWERLDLDLASLDRDLVTVIGKLPCRLRELRFGTVAFETAWLETLVEGPAVRDLVKIEFADNQATLESLKPLRELKSLRTFVDRRVHFDTNEVADLLPGIRCVKVDKS